MIERVIEYYFCLLYLDCCQGKCQETEQSSATEGPQPGPSGEGNPATPQSYSKDENKENSSGETSQMVCYFPLFYFK